MTTRRLFMLAAASSSLAPAIVRAESLMKIVVPKQEWLISWGPDLVETEGFDIFTQLGGDQRIGNRFMAYTTFFDPPQKIISSDWPSRTIKALPGGFKIARG